jgi:hypothetical protein
MDLSNQISCFTPKSHFIPLDRRGECSLPLDKSAYTINTNAMLVYVIIWAHGNK